MVEKDKPKVHTSSHHVTAITFIMISIIITTGTLFAFPLVLNQSHIAMAQQPQPQQTASTPSQSSGGVVKSNFNRTGFTGVSNLIINGKSFPVKYNITNGKVLGLVADNDKATIITVLGSQGDNGKLTIELPRNVIDAKGQGNKDAKFVVRIDDKGIDYKEIANSLKARILQIDFGKDDRVVEFTGTQTAS